MNSENSQEKRHGETDNPQTGTGSSTTGTRKPDDTKMEATPVEEEVDWGDFDGVPVGDEVPPDEESASSKHSQALL